MERNRKVSTYKAILRKFMSYRDEVEYSSSETFTVEQLSSVTATDVANYFLYRCYGTADPEESAVPVQRSNSVKYWKKGISFFMPNKHMQWNELTNSGNPTKSQHVAKVIKDVIQKEVRRQGAPSKARRSLTRSEFQHCQTYLKENESNKLYKNGARAHNNYQYHMIGRVDDCMQLQFESVATNDAFPTLALKTKLNWSKNVREERDCPWQFVFGSWDPLFCVLISMGLWLEMMIGLPYGQATPYVFALNADIRVPQGGDKSKVLIQKRMRENIFSGERFQGAAGTETGTHSVRKLAASDCRRKGCSKDERDYR